MHIWSVKTCNQDILKIIIAIWASNLVRRYRIMSSIARSFKLKMTLVTIIMNKHMVGGTVFHKTQFLFFFLLFYLLSYLLQSIDPFADRN